MLYDHYILVIAIQLVPSSLLQPYYNLCYILMRTSSLILAYPFFLSAVGRVHFETIHIVIRVTLLCSNYNGQAITHVI